MDGFKVRIRVEIVPASEADGAPREAGGISYVDEEAVKRVSAAQAVSIDDMEEVLLENAYEVMRRALGEHFAKVSKRGLSSGPDQAT
jgi:predicted glycosyltransferase involved in capsule biosynthesis